MAQRQRYTLTPSRACGDAENDSAVEVAAEVAHEIIAALKDKSDQGGKGKEKASQPAATCRNVAIFSAIILVALFAPIPWSNSSAQDEAGDSSRIQKMVGDCKQRLRGCQAQLVHCKQQGGCDEKLVSACKRLTTLCSHVHMQVTGTMPATEQQMPQPQLRQAVAGGPSLAAHRPQGMQQLPVDNNYRQREGREEAVVLQPNRLEVPRVQHLPSLSQAAQHAEQPERIAADHMPASQMAKAAQEPSTRQAVVKAHLPAQHSVANQDAGAAGTCKEEGTVLSGSCLCPALSAGPRCAGQAVLDGTCACTNGQTTPFEQKDHISKLVKRELPQAFYGPVVLAQDNPSANTGIKVHLPGKEPAWKKIGKVGSKEMKLLPQEDPVGKRLYRSCAIVGNSGILLLEAQGQEIDSHDFVMRFNGAPTKGLERFVGSKTTVRIVNHAWQDFRESDSEIILSHLRGPHHLENLKQKLQQSKGSPEKWYLLSPEFSSYAAQTAYEVATGFGINLQAQGEQAWTPTGGWTGIVMAMNICAKVDVYGFHISERQGVPYHYHNRCPQPFANRDSAEWMMVKSFSDHRLLELKDLCVSECHSSDEECQSCKAKHPVSRSVYEAGKALWQKGPMPDYCTARLTWLKNEQKAGRCTGLCGKFEKSTDWGKARSR